MENSGGLPMYIRRIANHLHQEKGMDISRAIATAVNVVKKMCATGDLNYPGRQNVNPGSHAEACAAVQEWEAKKAGARVAKGIHGRKLTDKEFVRILLTERRVAKRQVEISDEEFASLSKWVEADDPDTYGFVTKHDITKVDEGKRLAFGWASVGYRSDGSLVVDRQGDLIDDVDQIEKAAYSFVVDCREGGEMHIRKGIGTMVESFVSTPEKWEAMGIPNGTLPIGWWVGFRVTNDEVWKAVREGKYRMFSVHGRGQRKALD